MEDHIKILETKIEDQNGRFDEQNRKFEEMMSMMRDIEDLSRNLKDVNSHLAELSRDLDTGGIDSSRSSLGYVPILGLPKFNNIGTKSATSMSVCLKFVISIEWKKLCTKACTYIFLAKTNRSSVSTATCTRTRL